MRRVAAVEARVADAERLLADLDDFGPTAAEDRGGDVTRVFFASARQRDEALAHLARIGTDASAIDVPDEDWARRSQENLTPVVVGNICVTPPWHLNVLPALPAPPAPPAPEDPGSPALPAQPRPPAVVVIEPSMGFGTGHHATTRLCLQALQEIGVAGRDVLDVGTGSGVLAIAAALLGAADVLAVDNDPDAIQNARDNRALNPAAARVRIELVDAAAGLGASTADVVTANLTAAQLIRARDQIVGATRRGGAMILSGVLTTERAGVEAAFAPARVTASLQEDEWAALVLTL